MIPADQISQKVSEWTKTAEILKEYTDKCSGCELLKQMAERIVKCSEILDTYAGLVKFASDRYDENEKLLIRSMEEHDG